MIPALVGALGQAGAASVIGSGISAIAGGIGDVITGSRAKKSAKFQMQWQERMRNTAHQAEVRDLRLAGLNPILSANRGAPMPAGSMAQVPQYGNMGARLQAVASTVIQAKQLQEQINMNKSIKALNMSKAAEHDAGTIAKAAQAGLYTDQALREQAQKNLYRSQNQMLLRDLEFLRSISEDTGGSSTINQILRGIETFGRLIK